MARPLLKYVDLPQEAQAAAVGALLERLELIIEQDEVSGVFSLISYEEFQQRKHWRENP